MYLKKSKTISVIIFFSSLLISVPLISFSQGSVDFDEKERIKELSNEYQEALKTSEGINVVQLVSNNSIQFYNKIKRVALYSRENELLEEEIHVIMEVFFLRNAFDFDDLENLSGRELIIDNYTGTSSTLNSGENLTIEHMTKTDSNRIIVDYSSNFGGEIRLAYIKENGEWKVNLEDQSILSHYNLGLLLNEAEKKGYDKEFFVDRLIREVFNKRSDNLLSPLVMQK